MELKTPLYDNHVGLKGKMVNFGGYSLPIEYVGIIDEHMAVRKRSGLFDVSHMGEVLLTGSDALSTINNLLTNDFTSLKPGMARYSLMCNHDGGVIDDLLVYCMDVERYWLVVNAANRAKDVAWIEKNLLGNTKMKDISDDIGQIALQGPASKELMADFCEDADIPKKYYSFIESAAVLGIPCLISRTGYTGSFGYEVYCAAKDTKAIWELMLEKGKSLVMPAALGARDTLRIEASMPLYGHELTEDITPFEADLGFAIKMQKDDFIGRAALVKKQDPKRIRVGLKVIGRGIVRDNAKLFKGNQEVGFTTSGTHLPYLEGAYAMAMVGSVYSAVGTVLSADVRGRMVDVEVVAMPFFKN